MEHPVYKVSILRHEKNATLAFGLPDGILSIPLTEDKPNEVKNVFNKLIVELKKGQFSLELDDVKEDLFHFISKEYLLQLNTELDGVYRELEDYGLLEEKDA